MMIHKLFTVSALAVASAAVAQADEAQTPAVHDVRVASVPLIAQPLDLAQKSDNIWIKGDRPSANRIAVLTLRPVDGAVVEEPFAHGYAAGTVLALGVVGDADALVTAKDLGAAGERVYCTTGKDKQAGRIVCLEDRDRDGRFEAMALGLGEAGADPEQLSLLSKAEPLSKPVRYRAARADELPKSEGVYTNCAKDHDRPRYSFEVKGKADAVSLARLLEMQTQVDAATRGQILAALSRMSAGGNCQSADPIDRGDPLRPAALPGGAVAARLGELAISVGPKDAGAPVKLLGLRHPDRLYRLNSASVVPLSETVTTKQRALAVAKKFDKPVIATTGEARVFEGERKPGDVLLTAGFTHGYMGVLTADTKIRTLLSSRSLPKGTILYGMPMSTQTVMTRNGIPMSAPRIGMPGPDQVHLVWCVPVEEGGKWSATCLPSQGDRYTLLKGQYPAFEVTSLRYDAGTSTNDGPPPVAQGVGSFGKPLAYRISLEALTATMITVKQDTLFGGAVVHSKTHQIPRVKGGSSGLSFGSGAVVLSDGDGEGSLSVKRVGEFKPGLSARVTSGIVSRDASKPVISPPVAR